MCLDPDLADHLLQQEIRAPSRWVLSRCRLEFDFASMIFARKFLFHPDLQWFIHLRADASPKGGRDFLVSEVDYCQLPAESPQHICRLLENGRIQIRLLPLTTIGAKAASSVHKGFQLLKVLSMESADLRLSISRTMTMLFDFGAESGIWKLSSAIFRPTVDGQPLNAEPEPAQPQQAQPPLERLFHRALPLADCDHALHHDTLSAVAKTFGTFHQLDRHKDSVTDEYKRQLADLFRVVCPKFVDSRWHYLYDTLAWVVPRQGALRYLRLDELESQGRDAEGRDTDFQLSSSQLELLASLCGGPNFAQARFWAMAGLIRCLAEWGHRFAYVLHKCPCHSKWGSGGERRKETCPMEGRMGVPLASGLADDALDRLNSLNIPPHVTQALSKMQELSESEAAALMNAFRSDCLAESRQAAMLLIRQHDASSNKAIAYRFMNPAGPFREHLLSWASGRAEMNVAMFHELIAYSTGLCVMQRVEARHSLIKRNKSELLARLGTESRKAVHDPLTDLRQQQTTFNEALASICSGPSSDQEATASALIREHLRAAFERHRVYALRGCVEPHQWSVFRVVHMQADLNVTLQKSSYISTDDWKNCLAVELLNQPIDGEDLEWHPDEDTLHSVKEMAQASVKTGEALAVATVDSGQHAAALHWMEQNGILTEDGHVADAFVSIQTEVHKPVLVGPCRSRFSICHKLKEAGWREAVDSKTERLRASLPDKVFNPAAALEYFLLLDTYLPQLLRYDEAFQLRHAQPKAYYEAILAYFQKHDQQDCELQYVAPGQKADFWKRLRDYFKGDADTDPRVALDLMEPKRRARKARSAAPVAGRDNAEAPPEVPPEAAQPAEAPPVPPEAAQPPAAAAVDRLDMYAQLNRDLPMLVPPQPPRVEMEQGHEDEDEDANDRQEVGPPDMGQEPNLDDRAVALGRLWLANGERAIEACVSVGRSYHRTDTAARVAGVRKLLKHLGEVMTSVQFSSADPEKQVHEELNMWSEFSGYLTAELAAVSLANHCAGSASAVRGKLEIGHLSSADIAKSCQKIMEATAANECRFGNIENVVPADVLAEMKAPVHEYIEITASEVRKALGEGMTVRDLFKGQVLRKHMGAAHKGHRLVSLAYPDWKRVLKLPPDRQQHKFELALAALEATEHKEMFLWERRKNYDELTDILMRDGVKLDEFDYCWAALVLIGVHMVIAVGVTQGHDEDGGAVEADYILARECRTSHPSQFKGKERQGEVAGAAGQRFRIERCLHCAADTDITKAYKRGNKYSCSLCNGARIALQNHHRETGKWETWKAMPKMEKDNLIAQNRHRSLGKGKKFPVKCEEKATVQDSVGLRKTKNFVNYLEYRRECKKRWGMKKEECKERWLTLLGDKSIPRMKDP
ncbi:unnamed protein product [Symbiodinium sp. KB8]|nr:unnamed protein product [Symbiodinium sp. KB8]